MIKKNSLFFIMLITCVLCAGCASNGSKASRKPTPETTPDVTQIANPAWSAKVQEVLLQAFSLNGTQYKYGGKTPATGFDCSGFVRYVFQESIQLKLPSNAKAMSQVGETIKKEALQPGDLVFFNTLKSPFSHVGIYIGEQKFIHAPRTGADVRVENMQLNYWQSRFNGGQRLEKLAN